MTLVISPGYLPLGTVTVQRAVQLYVDGKAEIERAHPTRRFRSMKLTVPAPRVLRLRADVRLPARLFGAAPLGGSNHNLFDRDGRRCLYCGRTEGQVRHAGYRLTRDHVMPLSRGGRDVWRNVATACEPCNNAKADRTPDEAGMPLLDEPRTPTAWELVRARHDDVEELLGFCASEAA
ncbi:MAG TPA: HNH endonuclease [Longimicrobium sp.]|nr:HNH endonuclease [Longimicrobium sp.]